jgi:hypothetical protein
MNIFLNPSISEFQKLISKVANGRAIHDVVLDYDGEVLIDPQLEQPDLDLKKFKAHIRLQSLKPLRDLYSYLLDAWNDTFPGQNSHQATPRLSFGS